MVNSNSKLNKGNHLKTRKFIAKLGDFSCLVHVDDENAIVTPPEGVVLKPGSYQLFMAKDAEHQLGLFTVADDGTIGQAEAFLSPAVHRIIRLILEINHNQPAPAEELDSTLNQLEASVKALAGKLVCRRCGEEHGCEHWDHDEGEVRQRLEAGIKELADLGILIILNGLLDATATVHGSYGFQNRADIERQIARVETLLALPPQPVATAPVTPSQVDDEESGRRNPDAEDSPPA